MATTTTFSAIRDNYVGTDSAIGVLPALTPTASPPADGFRRADRTHRLREFCAKAGGSECFRLFELAPGDYLVDAETFDTPAREVQQAATLLVAYPTDLTALYGTYDLDDLWRIMDSDAQQLRDALYSPSNYVAGQSGAYVAPARFDMSGDVWFVELDITLIYTRAQSV